MKILKNYNRLYSRLKSYAPNRTISENSGRGQMGYDEYDVTTSGFRAIMLYIQLGLEEHQDIIREIVELLLKVQQGYGAKYPIVPAAFGRGDEFIHDKKYFDMGYYTDMQSSGKIAETIAKLSGTDAGSNPAVLPALFPKTDMRSLYSGKTKFESDDLMVIICKKDELAFSEHLELPLKRIKKKILIVEIDGNSANWHYRQIEPIFINMEEEMDQENCMPQKMIHRICENTCKQLKNIYEKHEDSRLIFPIYHNDKKDIRISEQEARFAFANELEKYHDYLFSVETPTEHRYKKFSSLKPRVFNRDDAPDDSRSAAVDLTMYSRQHDMFNLILNIEFKQGQPEKSAVYKDLMKLYYEKPCGLWFHLIENTNSGTINALVKKINCGLKYVRELDPGVDIKTSYIMFFIVILEDSNHSKECRFLSTDYLDVEKDKLEYDYENDRLNIVNKDKLLKTDKCT